MPEQALSDVKVLDLTWHIAGPYCTKMLADYGAEVLKIERPGRGDPARCMGPFLGDDPHPEKSGLFLHLNTNKRGITLNLKAAAGKKLFRELVKQADIVVENFNPHAMPSLGLGYEELEKLNPGLIMTSISNFGQYGPYRDFKLSELVLNAMGSDMHTHGLPEREPLKRGGTCIQCQAGLIAAVATMGAVFTRATQGFGQHIDVSMFETQVGTIDYRTLNIMSYIYTGEVAPRIDPRLGGLSILPSGAFSCKDGFIHSLVTPGWEGRLAKLMDIPDFAERFPDILDMTRKGELLALFMNWLEDRTQVQASFEAQTLHVPITPILTSESLLRDPQYRARDYWVEIEHPAVGRLEYPGATFKAADMPWKVKRPAPLLGEHNQEVYGSLGYTRGDLVKLREMGAI